MSFDDAEGAEKDGTWPNRSLRDAGAIKAMAHPLRLRLLELLGTGGPATATELARRVGESPANCSWHLRQLAAHGFITETGQGKGRQRYWEFVPGGATFSDTSEDGELDVAAQAGSEAMFEYTVAELRKWQVDRRRESKQWRDASFSSQSIAWLTADELKQLSDDIVALITAHIDRLSDPAKRPEGSRPIRFYATGIPARALEDHPTDDSTSKEQP